MIDAFILETLVSTGWRRTGETFWTFDEAVKAGHRMIRRSLARRVRVLPVSVATEAVAEFPGHDTPGGDYEDPT